MLSFDTVMRRAFNGPPPLWWTADDVLRMAVALRLELHERGASEGELRRLLNWLVDHFTREPGLDNRDAAIRAIYLAFGYHAERRPDGTWQRTPMAVN